MAKSFATNKLLGIIVFFSAICVPFNTNTGEGFMKKAIAYEAHEFVFIMGLNNFASMTQQQADATCQANFQALREEGIFDESVQRNQWHIWAHVQDRNCVMNINSDKLLKTDQIEWIPGNNRDKKFTVRIPRFR
jgi:hypothetical protein